MKNVPPLPNGEESEFRSEIPKRTFVSESDRISHILLSSNHVLPVILEVSGDLSKRADRQLPRRPNTPDYTRFLAEALFKRRIRGIGIVYWKAFKSESASQCLKGRIERKIVHNRAQPFP